MSQVSNQLPEWDKYVTDQKIEQKNGYYILTENIAKNMKKIRTDGTESSIYRLDQFLLKIPKSSLYHQNMIRSYYIGTVLNNLKPIVPNFVRTLGIFSYQKQIMVIQEYVEGETLENLLVKKKITFTEFLGFFIQILFALEIAQRQYRFCHYDLHLRNIIMRPIAKPYHYSIVIDTKRYDLVAEKYIPIIIDFGFASLTIDNHTVGSTDFPQYGMMPYLIQGADMYKFLFHSYAKADGDLQRQISTLFLFYGPYDPYRLLITPVEQIPEISKTYLKKVAFSQVATCLPLEMVLWVCASADYKTNLKIQDRNISLPLQFKQPLTFPKTTSYLAAKYIQKISGQNEEIDRKLLQSDLEMLLRYKTVHLPEEFALKDQVAAVLSIKLGQEPAKMSRFTEQLKPYLQHLYTIRELDLGQEYASFVSEFLASPHYQLYNNVCLVVEKGHRWAETLQQSLKTILS